jgi:hypothetical protein
LVFALKTLPALNRKDAALYEFTSDASSVSGASFGQRRQHPDERKVLVRRLAVVAAAI